MSTPPLIGVSTRLRDAPGPSGNQPTHTVARLYTDAVQRAGGIPLLVPPQRPEDVPSLIDRLDGLVLTGGGDVRADLYGLEHHETMYGVDDERDRLEIALVREAARSHLPLLAICRGIQVVNVALGGSLVRDIPSEMESSVSHFLGGPDVFRAHQRVRLDPDSRLARLLGTEELMVNSMHHQAVLEPGERLRPVGWSEDGVVEAVECTDDDWLLWAVQWHPEYLAPTDHHARALFEVLVEAAGS